MLRKKSMILAVVVVAMLWGQGVCTVWGQESRSGSRGGISPQVICLDGQWLLAIDPDNVGREQQWFQQARPDAKSTPVPWIIQDIFPDYHGVVWYGRDFEAPVNPHEQGRYLLRFWLVDYQTEVWVNGQPVGGHEGADGVFVLDVTAAVKPGSTNHLAVRVLNPKDEPIDGITLQQTPHRNKTCAYKCGADYNHGGIEDSVELLVVPAIWIEEMFVRPDVKSGVMRIELNVLNTLAESSPGRLQFTIAPAASGETLLVSTVPQELAPGETTIITELKLENPRLWQLNDPYLYRVTARLRTGRSGSFDERSVRSGFREFRLEKGYFRLNGRRIFLRSSVTGNMAPVGTHIPPADTDWFRRDLINCKAMGFNAIRFYGLATRYQLDLCDEIGLMVYEEAYSSQHYENSPKMAERFDRSTSDMIRRDRNHPSVVIWGLLNETADSPQFRHAVETLSLVRSLDDSRVVLLSSGRFDFQLGIGSISNPGSLSWDFLLGAEEAGAAPTQSSEKSAYMVPAYIEKVGDAHVYPWVPHTAKEIEFLRTVGHDTKRVFITEYGICSAIDLVRVTRHYEQRGKESSGEGRFNRQALDKFLDDWQRWEMAECFSRPEDYFTEALAYTAHERLLGINAVRANPNLVGYNLTGTVDQGYSGEGIVTTFREPKGGMFDAIFDGLAPLRWCLFAEPVNLYKGTSIKLEAVLANEDVLRAGEYPVRLEVFGPDVARVFERSLTVKIPPAEGDRQLALALPVFSEQVTADWPAGKYRFVASFERGAAAAAGEAEFYVAEAGALPSVQTEVVLWGEDRELAAWLKAHEVKTRLFENTPQAAREVILVGNSVPAPGGVEVFHDLAARIARGSTAVFLVPTVFNYAGQPTSLAAIGKKGQLINLPNNVYHKDDWAKKHAIFAGLPAGGFLDYTFYRELISNVGWSRADAPAETVAASIYAFTGYSSGVVISVDNLGAGRFVLNALRVRENLGKAPAAERLLLNMLRYAETEAGQPLADLPADFDERLKAAGL